MTSETDRGNHSARARAFPPIGKAGIEVFRGAIAGDLNGVTRNAGIRELIGIGAPEVQFPMTGSVLREPGDCVRRDAKEGVSDAVVNLIAATADARPDGRAQIAGINSQIGDSPNRGGDDACARAAPTRMDGRNDASARIGDEHRNTIGDADGNRAGRVGRDNGIRVSHLRERLAWPDEKKGAAVDLSHEDEILSG